MLGFYRCVQPPDIKRGVRNRREDMIPPCAIDKQVIFGEPLDAKSQFRQQTATADIFWPVVCRDSVQPLNFEHIAIGRNQGLTH